MKFIDLFAGIGGFRLGMEQVGHECVGFVEWDKFARASYEAMHDTTGEWTATDITKVDEEEINSIGQVDVICGGFPCQSFSVAGKRKGFEDTRGTLFFEIVRLAKVLNPKYMILENVKGLVNHGKGETLKIMLETLNEIGYTVDFEVLNSKFFGVPQNRERIFIIAVRDDLVVEEDWKINGTTIVPKAKQRLSDIRSFNFDYPQDNEVTTRLRDVLEVEVDEGYYLSEERSARLIKQLDEDYETRNGEGIYKVGNTNPGGRGMSGEVYGIGGISPTITASDYKDAKKFLESNEGLPIREATKQGYAIAQEGDAVNFQFPDSKTRRGRVGKQIANTLEASSINQGVVEGVPQEPQMLGMIDIKGNESIRRVYSTKACAPTLTTMGGGHREPKIAEEVRPVITPDRPSKRQNGRRFKEDNEEAFTLTSQDRHGVALGVTPNYRIRKLTPKECFRLQGVSDELFHKAEEVNSNSQLYKQAGNGVTVNVIYEIAIKLEGIK